MPRSSVSIALAGGFDAGNYGDALFPLLAECALRARLGDDLELTVYGFRDLEPGLRPYAVRDLSRLPAEISDHDLLLLGGGQLIRGDRLGPAFPPASPAVHDPLGIWLVPILTALVAGVPVAWNAPGVSPTIPEHLDPVVAAAVAGVRHLVVRDEQSSRWLAERASTQAAVVPDTAFGLADHTRPESGPEAAAILADAGIRGPYLILQPTAELLPWRDALDGVLQDAHAAGLEVLELPIGPALGDRPGVLGELPVPTRAAPRWPGPAGMVELIANAAGAAGMSYHLGVTATAFGVPHWRPPSPPGWKYEVLEALPGVTVFGRDPAAANRFGARTPSPDVTALRARVDAHWDAIASLATESTGAPV